MVHLLSPGDSCCVRPSPCTPVPVPIDVFNYQSSGGPLIPSLPRQEIDGEVAFGYNYAEINATFDFQAVGGLGFVNIGIQTVDNFGLDRNNFNFSAPPNARRFGTASVNADSGGLRFNLTNGSAPSQPAESSAFQEQDLNLSITPGVLAERYIIFGFSGSINNRVFYVRENGQKLLCVEVNTTATATGRRGTNFNLGPAFSETYSVNQTYRYAAFEDNECFAVYPALGPTFALDQLLQPTSTTFDYTVDLVVENRPDV